MAIGATLSCRRGPSVAFSQTLACRIRYYIFGRKAARSGHLNWPALYESRFKALERNARYHIFVIMFGIDPQGGLDPCGMELKLCRLG